MRISRVETPSTDGGENPLWDVAEQALYYVDNAEMKIHRMHEPTGETRTWQLPEVVTTLAMRKGGGACITLTSGICMFDFETGEIKMLRPLGDPPQMVYNDGTVDRRGRFLIGGSTNKFDAPQPDGGLFRLDPDHSLHRLDSGIHFSNSPCFSPDDKVLYFSDSWLKHCYAYDYDIETGAVANRRVFADTKDLGGLPDGATVDADGLVWIAIYGGGKIAAYRPDGTLERTIDMPVQLVSSVNFGGADLDRLYVTTIRNGVLGGPVEPGAGEVYVIDGLGARGVKEPRYAG